MVAEQWSLVHDPRPQPRVSSNTHPQVQAHSSEQYGNTTTTATGTAAGRNPQIQDITTTVDRRIQTVEEWKYKMTAYLGLQDPAYNKRLKQSGQSTGQVSNDQLENAAPSQAIAEQWVQLSNNLHYPLVSTCDGPASTICRQNTELKHGG